MPDDVVWPDADWQSGTPPDPAALERLLDQAFDDAGGLSQTYAVVVVHRGRVVAERYAGALEHWDRPAEPIGPDTLLLSWSVAKSVLHAVIGLLVGDGRLDVSARAPVPQWSATSDPRNAVTIEHMLAMRDGLAFREDYVDGEASDVIEMLFGSGQQDVASFAADRPLAAAPGERFSYSSGTTNILSGVVARLLGPGEPYRRYVHERLLSPLGISSARLDFDDAGTWIASSYLHMKARDFARFGYLYLHGGRWRGQQLLPAGWVEEAARPRSTDPEDGQRYGLHWWVDNETDDTFSARGYEGQRITVCPARDLVVVRLGKTPAERAPELRAWIAQVVQHFHT